LQLVSSNCKIPFTLQGIARRRHPFRPFDPGKALRQVPTKKLLVYD